MGSWNSSVQKDAVDTSTPQMDDEQFKQEVRRSAEKFKNFVQQNKIMMFSATYCSHCTVAKRTLEDLGTKYKSYELNKESDGEMMMDILSAVSGNRMVPAIFICGQLVPGGGSGLRHLQQAGQLTEVIKSCCDGDITCSKYELL